MYDDTTIASTGRMDFDAKKLFLNLTLTFEVRYLNVSPAMATNLNVKFYMIVYALQSLLLPQRSYVDGLDERHASDETIPQ